MRVVELERELGDLIERELGALGYELVKLESFFMGRRKVLRVFIDRSDGVSIDDCVRVTKALGVVLDGIESIPGPYNLEVSSPGADRPLTKREHFERFLGERARVEYREEDGNKVSVRGEVAGVDADHVFLSADGEQRRIALGTILRANLEPPGRERIGRRSAGRKPRRTGRGETF
jgi:ribosome maturation factor RimP